MPQKFLFKFFLLSLTLMLMIINQIIAFVSFYHSIPFVVIDTRKEFHHDFSIKWSWDYFKGIKKI